MTRRNSHLAIVPDDDADVFSGPQSAMTPATHRQTPKRIANVLDTGLGLLDNTDQLWAEAERIYTNAVGVTMRDYTKVHVFAERSVRTFEEAYPEAIFDLRAPMGGILSRAANDYEQALGNLSAKLGNVVDQGTTLSERKKSIRDKVAGAIGLLPEE